MEFTLNFKTISKIPAKCDECIFIGRYERGLWARNPHCCCELIWMMEEEDHKVDKNTLDENCPLIRKIDHATN